MAARIEIFDARSIDRFTARSQLPSDPSTGYLASLVADGARRYVDNAEVEVMLLAVDGQVLPLLISDRIGDRSDHTAYVCSPYTHYVDYTLEEVVKRNRRMPPQLFRALLWPLAAAVRVGGIDRVVFVNNWLLASNPRLNLTSEQVHELTARLVAMYPQSAIVFRAINAHTDEAALPMLRQNRYRLVRSRRIHLLDPTGMQHLDHGNADRDQRLLARAPYRIVRDRQTLAAQRRRLTQLYRDVYVERHSRLNPQFNERFFALTLTEGMLTYGALEQNGRIDGFIGYFADDRVMTAAVLGYDLAISRQVGLYRSLMALFIQDAAEAKLLLNLGAGKGHFKALRGAMPAQEFDAVYDRHLPPHRRFSWTVLATSTHLWSLL